MNNQQPEHRAIEALAASTEACQVLANVQRQLADQQYQAARQLNELGHKMEELASELAENDLAGSRKAA